VIDRPTNPSAEGKTPERTCPSWCVIDACIGEHSSGMTDVAATAGAPIHKDHPGEFPVVGLGLFFDPRQQAQLEPYAILALDHLNVDVWMRPRELRRLAEVALRLADSVEGVTR